MKASYAWLRELVPGLDASPRELADRLTGAGLEVEALTEFGTATRQVRVAEVVAIEPHPSRQKLRLVTVERGGERQRIVCGAPNVPEPGGLVALAPLGAELPGLGRLTPREIGGVRSEGMLCSELELGLSGVERGNKSDHRDDPGILVLAPGSARPGAELAEALVGAHDFILDIGVTPNRPDALGHVGIARDLAALYGLRVALPTPASGLRAAPGAVCEHVAVSIEDEERCPRYGAGVVVDVRVGPSPAWVRYRLESLGIRPIVNIVDVTNLLLLEFGYPMHAFDLDLVRGGRIVVRRARAGEPFTTLDGVKRSLDADDLVICDAEGPVALAGVMGGENSEIRGETRRVLLECAYFQTRGVRRASRRHGLHTESSHRFERGVDPGAIAAVLERAEGLLADLAGGSVVPERLLVGPGVPAPSPVRLRAARMSSLLGVTVPLEEARATLARLGFAVSEVSGAGDAAEVSVTAPSHRPDIAGEADLIEEVVRVRGLDTIPTVLPAIAPQPPRTDGVVAERTRVAAISVGLSEAVTYAFVAPRELTALGLVAEPLALMNPLSEERSVMRTSLLPGLVEALRRARRRGVRDVRLFTTGSRILPSSASSKLPDELPSFAAVLAGSRQRALSKPEELDVYDAKGVAVELIERITRMSARVEPQPEGRRLPYLHPRGAADVFVGDVHVGAFGPLHPDCVDSLDLDGPCMVVELDLRSLERIGRRTPKVRPIPVLPAATRDVALVVHDDVPAGAVAEAIREAAGSLCESVELFDLFRGGSVPEGHRSLAFHVVYRDPRAALDPESARTLKDEEVDQQHAAVVDSARQRFGAVLRG